LFAPYLGAKSRESPHNLKPVGTGPYLFTEFKPGDIVKGQLNPNYHGPNRPHFDAIEIKGGGDAVSAARAVLQTGEFDYVEPADRGRAIEAHGGQRKGRVAISAGGNTEMIWLNMTDPWTEVDGERANRSRVIPSFRPQGSRGSGTAAGSQVRSGIRLWPPWRGHRERAQ
jgi:peptide/nickel transport system substrate-binding protein